LLFIPAYRKNTNHTQEYAARRRGEDFERLRYATPYPVQLSPLPCWEDLPADLRKKRIEEIACEIEEEIKARLTEKGIPPLALTPFAARTRNDSAVPRGLDAKRQAPLRVNPVRSCGRRY
jgi:hypothetical protein